MALQQERHQFTFFYHLYEKRMNGCMYIKCLLKVLCVMLMHLALHFGYIFIYFALINSICYGFLSSFSLLGLCMNFVRSLFNFFHASSAYLSFNGCDSSSSSSSSDNVDLTNKWEKRERERKRENITTASFSLNTTLYRISRSQCVPYSM